MAFLFSTKEELLDRLAQQARELEAARKRIARLEALILGLHLEQDDEGTGPDTARLELEWEGQRIHGCAGSGQCEANIDAEPIHGDEEGK